MRARFRFRLIATVFIALAAAVAPGPDAHALGTTDYTLTATSGLYESPPPSATAVGTGLNSARVDLPFEFSYFGVIHDHVTITTDGIIYFGNDTGSATIAPQNVSTIASGSTTDGACAPYWWPQIPSSILLGRVVKWIAGTGSSRRLILSWEDATPWLGGPAVISFQVKLHQTTNRIEFAYKPDTVPSTWQTVNYAIGMVAPGSDPRWFAPVNTATNNLGRPANDYRMDPRTVTLTGTLLVERPGSFPSGVAGIEVEAVYAGGKKFGRATTDSGGGFQIRGTAGIAAAPVDIHAYAQGTACLVKAASASTAASRRIATGVDVSADNYVGTITVDAAGDPGAVFRGPAAVASAVQRARDWAQPNSVSTIPQITITWDAASAATTAYKPAAGIQPASMTVGGPASPNEDTWDEAAIIRTYGRHVLATLASPAAPAPDDAFDKTTNDTNAFAAGFGHVLAVAVTGQSTFSDTGIATGPLNYSLEDPQPVSPRGANSTAWVAAALYDLVDAANEASDIVNGVSEGAAQVMRAADTLGGPPDAAKFQDAWITLGYGGAGVSRIFIAEGLVADDAFEANDSVDESRALGSLGVRRDGLALSAGNEDWFDVEIPDAAGPLTADVAFPRTISMNTVELEMLTLGGTRVADVVDAGTGPVSLSTGQLAAGRYRLRVAHVAGRRVPSYTLQIGPVLTADATPLPSWTVGFAYDVPLTYGGGLGGLTLAVESGTAPPGLTFDPVTRSVHGTPTAPGIYDFELAVKDGGNPQHAVTVPHHVVISEAVAVVVSEFVPFALGKVVPPARPVTGGTEPVVLSVTSGAFPDGVALDAGDGHFVGTPTTPGSTAFALEAADAVGSADQGASTAVVCVPLAAPKTPVPLAAGAASCGVFFDAVAGSSVKLAVATTPKQPLRALRAVLVAADGSSVDGVTVTQAAGRASIATAALPASGRYFAILSANSGAAVDLLASLAAAPPKKGKGLVPRLAHGETTTVEFGALAGATVTLKATPSKKAKLTLAVVALLDPRGAEVSLDGLVTQKGASTTLTAPIRASGTWRAVIAASGPVAGEVTYSLKLKQPKGVTYSAD